MKAPLGRTLRRTGGERQKWWSPGFVRRLRPPGSSQRAANSAIRHQEERAERTNSPCSQRTNDCNSSWQISFCAARLKKIQQCIWPKVWKGGPSATQFCWAVYRISRGIVKQFFQFSRFQQPMLVTRKQKRHCARRSSHAAAEPRFLSGRSEPCSGWMSKH